MHPARRALIAVVLLGLGFVLAPLVMPLFSSDADWEQQVQVDALTATDLLLPYRVNDVPDSFWDRWDRQVADYDEGRFASLRERLSLYLDFLVAEYGEAADIYVSGVDPREVSETLRALRGRLPAAFGEEAARKMVADADEMREHAYRVSPRIAGVDPDAPDFRVEADGVRAWMTIARPRVEALTTPPGER